MDNRGIVRLSVNLGYYYPARLQLFTDTLASLGSS